MSFANPDRDGPVRGHTAIHAPMSAGEKHVNECVAQFNLVLQLHPLCRQLAEGCSAGGVSHSSASPT